MATDRVFKSSKVIHFPSAAKTADGMYDKAGGAHMTDISDVNWKRIVLEVNCTAITGTNYNAEVVTTNDPDFDGDDTIANVAAATKADGSTAFDSGNISATGRTMKSASKYAADGSAASNIGKFIGLAFDDNATTVTDEAWLFVEGD